MFYDILERKIAFLGYKNKKLKKVEKLTFFQRVCPWFLCEISIFPSFVFYLGNIGKENVFYYILEQKNAFLCYKNKKLKKSKN